MKNIAIQFTVVLLAALIALFLFDKFREKRAVGDFGAGEAQFRLNLLRNDLMRALGPAKVSMAEYYASRGQWPDSNQQLGLPPPEAYRGESLRSLVVSGADITLTFAARSGVAGGQIIFTAHADNLAMGINFTCGSPNLPAIENILPDCRYGQL